MTPNPMSRRTMLRASAAALGAGALSLAAACGGSTPPSSGGSKGSGATSGSGGSGSNPSKVSKLTLLNASNGLKPELTALSEEYQKQTGVAIEITTDGSTYDQTLHARAESGQMPDLFYPTGAARLSDIAPYVKSGWTLDLTSEMNDGWKSSFKPELLEFCQYKKGNIFGVDPGTYLIPFDGSDWQFYVLPDVWKKAGLDPNSPPKTFDEFISNMKTLKKSTPEAFGMALSQSYVTEAYLQTYASTVMSADDIAATAQGKAPWSSKAWESVLDSLVQIRDADILAPGSINAQMPDMEKGFFSRKSLGCFWGFTIDIPVGQVLAPNWSDFTVFMPPPMNAGDDVKLAGGLGKCMSVNAKSENKDAALDFLKWFMEPTQQTAYGKAVPAIPANPSVPSSDLDPRVVPFADALANILPPEVAFAAPVSDALNRGIQDLMNKSTDAKSILSAADDAQKQSS